MGGESAIELDLQGGGYHEVKAHDSPTVGWR